MTSNESTWKEALAVNFGDYAYGPQGEMIDRQEDGTYTVRTANTQAWIAGDLDKVEREQLSEEEIPDALEALGVASEGWSFE